MTAIPTPGSVATHRDVLFVGIGGAAAICFLAANAVEAEITPSSKSSQENRS